jgi:hypothetical protein
MKSLKNSALLGLILGVLLAQVACGGGIEPPEAPCTDAEGVDFDCPLYGNCNKALDIFNTHYCDVPDDGNCCIPDPVSGEHLT